jgi:hypothetical protein
MNCDFVKQSDSFDVCFAKCKRCGRSVSVPTVHLNSGKVFSECVVPVVAKGPGTELKKLLAGWPFRFVAGADCKCTRRAAHMDEMGCDWVEENIDECVGYLRESAADRGLPFLDVAGRLLVRRAIANARRNA